MTWLRRFPDVAWLEAAADTAAEELAAQVVEMWRGHVRGTARFSRRACRDRDGGALRAGAANQLL